MLGLVVVAILLVLFFRIGWSRLHSWDAAVTMKVDLAKKNASFKQKAASEWIVLTVDLGK
jgi:hypothetical protein